MPCERSATARHGRSETDRNCLRGGRSGAEERGDKRAGRAKKASDRRTQKPFPEPAAVLVRNTGSLCHDCPEIGYRRLRDRFGRCLRCRLADSCGIRLRCWYDGVCRDLRRKPRRHHPADDLHSLSDERIRGNSRKHELVDLIIAAALRRVKPGLYRAQSHLPVLFGIPDLVYFRSEIRITEYAVIRRAETVYRLVRHNRCGFVQTDRNGRYVVLVRLYSPDYHYILVPAALVQALQSLFKLAAVLFSRLIYGVQRELLVLVSSALVVELHSPFRTEMRRVYRPDISV